jgi:hypothetical protein
MLKKLLASTLTATLLLSAFPFSTFLASTTAVKGDMNGDGKVTSTDAVATLKFAVETAIKGTVPTSQMLEVADINEDGRLTSADAVLILSYVVANTVSLVPMTFEMFLDKVPFDKMYAHMKWIYETMPSWGYNFGDISITGVYNYSNSEDSYIEICGGEVNGEKIYVKSYPLRSDNSGLLWFDNRDTGWQDLDSVDFMKKLMLAKFTEFRYQVSEVSDGFSAFTGTYSENSFTLQWLYYQYDDVTFQGVTVEGRKDTGTLHFKFGKATAPREGLYGAYDWEWEDFTTDSLDEVKRTINIQLGIEL